VRPSLTVYRVGQEALTNIRRHTRTERVELILRYDTDGTRLTTSDHAERSSPANATSQLGGGGYGLTGMRERAELLGGSLEAGHTPHGLRVELWIAA
jgi:signal transduction histidine kinase